MGQHKLRHIAIPVRDIPEARKFFEEAFGMTRAGNARNGIIFDLTASGRRGAVENVKPAD